MDRLPCNLLHNILKYMDQPLDLLRMSYVCSRLRALIMADEDFLNQWFSRSLEHSRQSWSSSFFSYENGSRRESMSDIDRLLLPVNLRSSVFEYLPWTYLGHSHDSTCFFEHCYPLSFFESSHSFSFWLFLPHQSELNIQIGNFHVDGVCIVLCANENDYFDKEKRLSMANRWIHIVLIKIDSQHNYRMWVDAQYISTSTQYRIDFSDIEEDDLSFNLVLVRKFDNNISDASTGPRIADLIAFKRCLTLVEIRAIYQQQTSIKQVKVGTYINKEQNTQHKSYLSL